MEFVPKQSFLAKINNPNTTAHGVLSTLLTSGLTLIEPRALGLTGRFLYRSSLGAVAGWMTYAALCETEELISTQQRATIALGASAAVLATAEISEALDARIHDALKNRGVQKPRALYAAGTAILSAGSWWAGRNESAINNFGWMAYAPEVIDSDGEQPTIEIPQPVLAVMGHLLNATDDFCAPVLRSQLEQARAIEIEGEDSDDFYPGIEFEVPDDVERALPFNATFGITGRFYALGEKSFDVSLQIFEGKISHLTISEGQDWTNEDYEAMEHGGVSVGDLSRWPEPEELELFIETPHGLKPMYP